MNKDKRILNKILANQTQQYRKRIYNTYKGYTHTNIYLKDIKMHHDQVGFIPGIQGWLNIQKSINVIYRINKLKQKNNTMMSIDAEKAVQNLISIPNKSTQ